MKACWRITQSAVFAALFLGLTCCSDKIVDPPNMVDSGSWYETGFTPWPHDGNPLEGERFVIYSDAASLEARQYLLQICEDAFANIKEKLGLTDLSVLRFPEGRNDKIHIYAYRNYSPTQWGGQAYYGGYLIYSPDNPAKAKLGQTTPELYVPLVRHEMVHVVQTLIVGDNQERVYSWFAEGIAIQIADDSFYTKVETKADLNGLVATFGMRNPVSVQHSWTMPDDQKDVGVLYYYPMFSLAVRYLLGPNGIGATYLDVRDLMIDIGNGDPFETALENRVGISNTEYESQFFDRISQFLN